MPRSNRPARCRTGSPAGAGTGPGRSAGRRSTRGSRGPRTGGRSGRPRRTARGWRVSSEPLGSTRESMGHPYGVGMGQRACANAVNVAAPGRGRRGWTRSTSAVSSAATTASQPLSSARAGQPGPVAGLLQRVAGQHAVADRRAGRPARPGSARRSPRRRRTRSAACRRGSPRRARPRRRGGGPAPGRPPAARPRPAPGPPSASATPHACGGRHAPGPAVRR